MSGGHFSRPLGRFEWIDGTHWRILDGFRYYLTEDEGPAGEFVDVPDGFVTNFASIPRPLWALFPPTGRTYAQISCVHDKLFTAPVSRSAHSARPCRFRETAHIYVDGAKAAGAAWLVRRTMFRMLQLFSHPSWEAYRAQDRKA